MMNLTTIVLKRMNGPNGEAQGVVNGNDCRFGQGICNLSGRGISLIFLLISCQSTFMESNFSGALGAKESVGGMEGSTGVESSGTSSDEATAGGESSDSDFTSSTMGVGTGEEEFPFGEPLSNDAQRDRFPDVDEDDLRRAGEATAKLSWDLYQVLRNDGANKENIALSAISVQYAFALLHAASEDKTKLNIEESLRLSHSGDILHSVLNALSLELADRERPKEPHYSSLRLRLAFGVWLDQNNVVDPLYPEWIGTHYGASLWRTPILADPEGAAKRVNRWVSKQTEGLIPDLVNPPPSSYVTAMLVNAMYLYAPWALPFPEDRTEPGIFHGLDGEEISVEYMNFEGPRSLHFFEDESLQGVGLPYRDHQLVFLILLPKEGQFDEVSTSMTAARMQEIRQNMDRGIVKLKMPKFNVESRVDLLDPLVNRFELDSGINLWAFLANEIFRVLHRVVLKIDETGTEGAAATLVEVGDGDSGVEEEEPEFTMVEVDRPFLFSIEDRKTGAVLFSGQITVPQ